MAAVPGAPAAADAWRGVAAGPWALGGDLGTGGVRRGRAMSDAAHHLCAGQDGGEGSGIAVNSARDLAPSTTVPVVQKW